MFNHLHVHSYYSFLDGLASPAELARTAAEYEMPAIGLADIHSLTGALEFYDACREHGVTALLGLELRIANLSATTENLAIRQEGAVNNGSLLLYAMDLSGWASLCRLSSLVSSPKDSLPIQVLAGEASRLICLSGGRRGAAWKAMVAGEAKIAEGCLDLLNDIFPGRLYVELQQHAPGDAALAANLARLAGRLKLPTVATHSIYYLTEEEARLQRVVSAIRLNQALQAIPETEIAPPAAYFCSTDEMQKKFFNFPVALEIVEEIVERCRFELPLDRAQFPQVETPHGETVMDLLRKKALAGASSLYPSTDRQPVIQSAVQERLEHELDVIERCGYASLFLIMQEIIAFAHAQGIPTASRGSASSSLVAHCLGITSPDPVRLNLYFERFLNPARAKPPDIDTDLCSRRRDEVIRFVYERFGQDRVAMVATISRFRRRSALREVAKVYGLPGPKISELVNSLPERGWGPPGRYADQAAPFEGLALRYPGPPYQDILRDAEALLGIPDHLSIHPGGVVIAPGPITDLAPTMLAPKGVRITQFDLDGVERLGLIKLDLLGIRGLTVLGDVAAAINLSSSSLNPLDVLESISHEDPETRHTIRQANTIGCFQIESPGMRATLREIQADSIDDLTVALALYRPGPLTGGLKDAFVRRHLGMEAPSQLHPSLTPLLADTYGVILYQEQVLRIAHELAGLSLADADLLRRAMSHFDPGKQMQTLKEKFIAGALALNGVPEAISERVWELMAAFAGYGFPKAHAASYAVVGWRAAWCKTHHPALFMAAVLANWGGYYSQRVYLNEARRMKLKIRPPHINHAHPQFSVSFLDGEPILFMGLDQVRELTRRTMDRIQALRPFHSLADFLARADPRPGEAKNLIQVGALEGFGMIPNMLRQLEGGWVKSQMPLFSMGESTQDDWSLDELTAAQGEILGVGVAAHPLELVANQITASGAMSTLEAAGRVGDMVRIAGMRQTWRRVMTARGEPIYFMSLEDLEGAIKVMISAEVLRRYRSEFSGVRPYIVEGRVERDEGDAEPVLIAERIFKL